MTEAEKTAEKIRRSARLCHDATTRLSNFSNGDQEMSKSENFWDNAAGNYDKTEEKFEFIHKKSREKLKSYLDQGDVVLDYGCGTGTTSCAIAGLVKQIHAIDISSKMIEIAKRKASSENIENITFEQSDIFDKKYSDNSFDVILAFNMLHTVPDPKAVVDRIYELLKDDGMFISITPCLRDKLSFAVNAQIQIVRVLCALGVIPVPIRRLKHSDLDDLIARGNFHVVDSEKIFSGASSYFVVAKKMGNAHPAS